MTKHTEIFNFQKIQKGNGKNLGDGKHPFSVTNFNLDSDNRNTLNCKVKSNDNLLATIGSNGSRLLKIAFLGDKKNNKNYPDNSGQIKEDVLFYNLPRRNTSLKPSEGEYNQFIQNVGGYIEDVTEINFKTEEGKNQGNDQESVEKNEESEVISLVSDLEFFPDYHFTVNPKDEYTDEELMSLVPQNVYNIDEITDIELKNGDTVKKIEYTAGGLMADEGSPTWKTYGYIYDLPEYKVFFYLNDQSKLDDSYLDETELDKWFETQRLVSLINGFSYLED